MNSKWFSPSCTAAAPQNGSLALGMGCQEQGCATGGGGDGGCPRAAAGTRRRSPRADVLTARLAGLRTGAKCHPPCHPRLQRKGGCQALPVPPPLGLLNPTSAGFQGCTLKLAPVPPLLPAVGELHLPEAVALIQPYPEQQR